MTFTLYKETDHFISDLEEKVLESSFLTVPETVTPEQVAASVGTVQPILKYKV